LRDRGLDPLPSSANFVMVPVAGAGRIGARMRELGVAVRPFVGLPQISAPLAATSGDALRITVGPREEIESMLSAFDRARRECA
jgi:histidinol-phosphate/aromatic aminotransferase/cobyric acid decarboxylase-like protein